LNEIILKHQLNKYDQSALVIYLVAFGSKKYLMWACGDVPFEFSKKIWRCPSVSTKTSFSTTPPIKLAI